MCASLCNLKKWCIINWLSASFAMFIARQTLVCQQAHLVCIHFQMLIGPVASLAATQQVVSALFFFGNNCISCYVKKQPIVARSSVEPEYRFMAATAAKITWFSFLLHDLNIPLTSTPVLHYDNLNALHITIDLVFHA